jgi:hypothetical protein
MNKPIPVPNKVIAKYNYSRNLSIHKKTVNEMKHMVD